MLAPIIGTTWDVVPTEESSVTNLYINITVGRKSHNVIWRRCVFSGCLYIYWTPKTTHINSQITG